MAELTVPQINFSSLADLPQVYRNARNQATRDQILSSSDPNNLSLSDLTNRLLVGNDLEGAKSVAAIQQAQAAGNSVYGTPIYGTVNGQNAVGTFDKRGQFHPINTGSFQPTPGIKTIDTGTGTVIINSRSGQPVQNGFQVPGGANPAGQPTTVTAPNQQSAPQAAPMPNARQAPSQPGYVPKDVSGEARDREYGREVGKRQAAIGQAKNTLDTATSNIDRMSDVARSLINDPALERITGVEGYFPNYPGGRAADAQARLNNLTSQAGFAVLEAMRDASKTGGALGQVSDFENRQLQNNLAALAQAQSAKQYRQELAKIIQWGEGVKQRLGAAYQQDYANIPRPNPAGQPTTVTAPNQQSAPQAAPMPNARQAPDGNWYVPDPNRPGKYLQVK